MSPLIHLCFSFVTKQFIVHQKYSVAATINNQSTNKLFNELSAVGTMDSGTCAVAQERTTQHLKSRRHLCTFIFQVFQFGWVSDFFCCVVQSQATVNIFTYDILQVITKVSHTVNTRHSASIISLCIYKLSTTCLQPSS